MIVIPAIDLLDGACVRLTQGKLGTETVYSREPQKVALKWEQLGAPRLHVVDLNGAFSGQSNTDNLTALKEILAAVTVPVQLGGGIRNLERARQLLNLGVRWVIMSTAVLGQESLIRCYASELGEHLLVSVDSRAGKLLGAGWTEEIEMTPAEFAHSLVAGGVDSIIYTGAARDGTMAGPDLNGIKSVLGSGAKVIAAGGIGTADHIRQLKEACPNLYGVVVGKALYSKNLTLEAALDAARED
ncbi:MAG: 1-(5-phosphoribosyl)-5-[(5-phosphoribosylamino)methylideneamino] imidazole-4-carboxamide isomerase [bacterium]|jgi:phosphoribosylformimino-5-aminoimidazole carboxamide ribotide isomerase